VKTESLNVSRTCQDSESHFLQCVAVQCSVLQCAASCCSVLQSLNVSRLRVETLSSQDSQSQSGDSLEWRLSQESLHSEWRLSRVKTHSLNPHEKLCGITWVSNPVTRKDLAART